MGAPLVEVRPGVGVVYAVGGEGCVRNGAVDYLM